MISEVSGVTDPGYSKKMIKLGISVAAIADRGEFGYTPERDEPRGAGPGYLNGYA